MSTSTKSTFTQHIETELARRAAHYLHERYLVVDYYRIRRRLAYPLPVRSLHIPELPIPDIPLYPWATWMTWELEERVHSLGWAAQLLNDDAAREAVCIDLLNLAQWPQYRQYPNPDLSLGHATRLLATSLQRWKWLPAEIDSSIENALRRILQDSGPLVQERLGAYRDFQQLLAAPDPHLIIGNIPTIGSLGVAMAANAIDAADKSTFNAYLTNAILALFALRENSLSEGVAYDGYVLDFVMDWLAFLPQKDKSTLMDHPQFGRFWDESLLLGAPGNVAQVAEMGDVEARQMPFHISAQAKANAAQPLPERAWYLQRCPLEMLRADALAALHLSADQIVQSPQTPAAGVAHAHCALALRGGWDDDDVSVVIAASNSPMGHIHPDNGAVTIGTRGEWFIATPGYQQYLRNSEREFSTGPASRNTPLINGQTQISKAAQVIELQSENRCHHAEMDLTRCYPEDLQLQQVSRRVQLQENRRIVIEDTIRGAAINDITYFWHAHPDAAWWIEDGRARIYFQHKTLWISSPQIELQENQLQRLRGSRGQLTLQAKVLLPAATESVVRWEFVFEDE